MDNGTLQNISLFINYGWPLLLLMGAYLIGTIIERLEEICGPVDWVSPELFFDRTKYYAKEMGWPLHRRFIAFEKLALPDYPPPLSSPRFRGQAYRLIDLVLDVRGQGHVRR